MTVTFAVAAYKQANATCTTTLFPEQFHRKTHRSRGKQNIASDGSENTNPMANRKTQQGKAKAKPKKISKTAPKYTNLIGRFSGRP